MINIDIIMDMLKWDNSEDVQIKGLELASKVKCYNVFFQPRHADYYINVWDNCAKVISKKSDDELYHYLPELFEWIQDMNWPGAKRIFERLLVISKNVDAFDLFWGFAMKTAESIDDEQWVSNLKDLSEKRSVTEISH